MTSITLNVTGARIRAAVNGPLTSGMVGIPVTIRYDNVWNGLTKNLVCRCGKWGPDKGETRTVLNIGETTTVAHEVMQADMHLYLGIEGYSANGKLVIPTIWADCGAILHGANTGENLSTDPKLSIWAQLQAEIEKIKQTSVTEGKIAAAVTAYLKENPIESSAVKTVNGTVPDADGNVEIIIPDSSPNVNCLLTVEAITIGDGSETVAVTGITLDYNSISLNEGESMMLAASVLPSNATNTTIIWESSNNGIATVNNGYVTAVAEGNAVITAKSAENNSIKATCSVAVAAESGGDEPGGESGVHNVPLYTVETLNQYMIRKNGTQNNEAGAWSVEVPYYEGMTIRGACNKAWSGNYTAGVVISDGVKAYPDTTFVDGLIVATSVLTTATLTGYTPGSVVVINLLLGTSDTTEELARTRLESLKDVLYYTYED